MTNVSRLLPLTDGDGGILPAAGKSGLEGLAAFAERARSLETTLAALERIGGEAAATSFRGLRQDLTAFEPAITILGQVKSGKTTLVNAMAGWSDLLPSDVNPWTSVVTSLHLRPGAHRKDISARFQLMMADEWDRLLRRGGRLGELAERADAGSEMEKIRQQIAAMREKSRARLGRRFEMMLGQVHEYGYFDRNLLERYVCLGDDFQAQGLTPPPPSAADDRQGWFSDITRSADLFLNCETVPVPLCLRDTPGVNDTFLMREQVTINAVRDSRICVVVLSAQQALTSVDMGLIRLISNLQSRNVIIFVNRIDELADPAAEVGEIESSIRETLRRHAGPADAEILFGSAYWANKVLSDAIDDLAPASRAALVNWAEAQVRDADADLTPAEMVWVLSGLPRLFSAISAQVVGALGTPLLRRIASAAVAVAGSLQARNAVLVAGQAAPAGADMPDPRPRMEMLAQRHLLALSAELGEVTAAFQDRAERAHATFLERASHALLRHLEERGEDRVWEYDATGLRVLLKSAHTVFAARARAVAGARFRAAVEDLAELLYSSFGEAVEGIELDIPEVPDAPAPVTLAQTLILDFNDGWWMSWWRRARGIRAMAEKFHAMIAAETTHYMAEFKTAPARDHCLAIEATLRGLLDQGRTIVAELSQPRGELDTLPVLGPAGQGRDRRLLLGSLLASLKPFVDDARMEAPTP